MSCKRIIFTVHSRKVNASEFTSFGRKKYGLRFEPRLRKRRTTLRCRFLRATAMQFAGQRQAASTFNIRSALTGSNI